MVQNFPVNLSGAVDLSALAQANAAKTAAAPARKAGNDNANLVNADHNGKIAGALIRKLNETNLKDTLELSAQVPFVLVFYSAQSPNSEKLRKSVENLAVQYQGRFGAGTVSTDEQPAVAQAFGVNAVPAAAALLQGQPIPLFQGLPNEEDIIQTIEKLLAAAAQYGIVGVLDGTETADQQTPPDPELSPLHQEGNAALNAGDLPRAQAAYAKALKENPHDLEAKTALAQVELLQRMDLLNPNRDSHLAQEILMKAAKADLADIAPHLDAADIEMALGRPDAAFRRLIDVIAAVDGEQREKARERILRLFETLGAEHELVKSSRRALANVLF
ncbi:tetratricopeptide repeat protein [Arcanobacterium hippocoleae]